MIENSGLHPVLLTPAYPLDDAAVDAELREVGVID